MAFGSHCKNQQYYLNKFLSLILKTPALVLGFFYW
jgi:hypothetical protein